MTKEELEKEARFRTKGWKEQENCVQAYLAGAEPREKHIVELEKENADLQKSYEELYNSMRIIKDQRNEFEKENVELKTVKIPQLERKIASIRGAHSVDCKKLNAKIEQCERQKEFIENLKEDIKNKDLALEDYAKWSENQKKKADEQLAKAKTYLEQLVSEITVGELEVDPNILQQVENFLK